MINSSLYDKASINSILISIYYFSFVFLKPITTAYSNYSTIIMGFFALLIVVVFLLNNRLKINRLLFMHYAFLVLLFTTIFLFQIVFFYNSNLLNYAKDYLIFGVITGFLTTGYIDYNSLIKYWSLIGVVVGVIFCVDPFLNYRLFGNYLSFGYTCLLPSITSCVLLITVFNKTAAYFPLAIFVLILFVCGNKGAIFTSILLFLVMTIITNKTTRAKIRLLLLLFLLSFAFLYRDAVIAYLLAFASKLGFRSYSLNTIAMLLNGRSDSIISLRTDIWADVWQGIKSHLILGNGIGSYISKTGIYPHNFLLEIWHSIGLLGLVLFLFLIIATIYLLKIEPNKDKVIFLISMLIIWIIPLSISLTIWQYLPFWFYISLIIINNNYSYKALVVIGNE